MNYIPGHGNSGAKIVVVAESPHLKDRKALDHSREVLSLIKESGISPSDLWLTNVSKYFVPPNELKGKKIKPF